MATKTIRCQFCGTEGPSAKAHIIPAAFYRSMQDYPGQVLELVLSEYSTEGLPQGTLRRQRPVGRERAEGASRSQALFSLELLALEEM